MNSKLISIAKVALATARLNSSRPGLSGLGRGWGSLRARASLRNSCCWAWKAYVGGYVDRAQEHLKLSYAGHLKRRLALLVEGRIPG